jgi:DNA adenine methylase
MKMLNSPLWWQGGKGRIAKYIIALFDDHVTYVEPFGGGAAVLLNKEPSKVEVYNDINGDVVNFFQVLADPDTYDEFVRRVSLLPWSRRLFNEARTDVWQTMDPVRRAALWFVMARQSFGGDMGNSWGMAVSHHARGMAGVVASWLSTIERLPEIHARLQRVQFECYDWRIVLDSYDTPKTLFYLDPPYILEARRSGEYDHEMSVEDHQDLIDMILHMKGKILISGYPHPVYFQLDANGWDRYEFDLACQTVGKTRGTGLKGKGSSFKDGRKQRRTDCLWLNYKPKEEPGEPIA